jgi:hypothetical protein
LLPKPFEDERFNLGCSKKGTSSSNSEILKELVENNFQNRMGLKGSSKAD